MKLTASNTESGTCAVMAHIVLLKTKAFHVAVHLSPLLGSSFIYYHLMSGRVKNKIDYVRYMDDVVILTKTRHQVKTGT